MKLSKTARKRLGILIRYMRSLPNSANRHFDMRAWFRHSGDDHNHELKIGQQVGRTELTYCGTSACALGWATTVPAFHRAGLRLFHKGIDRWGIGTVKFGRRADFRAAGSFFKIDTTLATTLFGGIDAKSPKGWARQATRALSLFEKAEDSEGFWNRFHGLG